ncbi:MAG: hypothetical protein WB992_02350 [Bryobacteraceae bacterium]
MSNIKSRNIEKTAEPPDTTAETTQAVQLSRLSSILNGLESGASAMHRHLQHAMSAVRSGTYKVDPLQLSRRIVGDAVGSARKLARIGRRRKTKPGGSASLPSTPSQI